MSEGASSQPDPLPESSALLELIDKAAGYFEEYGFPRIGGKMIGLLLIASRPVSAEEMADLLQVSRSSITTNLKTLDLLGLIEQVSVPSQREEYFVFSEDGLHKLLEMRRESTSELLQTVREKAELVQDEQVCQRLERLRSWLQMLDEAYDNLLQAWQQRSETPP
ncbi:MAG: HTH domain-containing protein [bacterium]|nr:HTH domain-containing protein [bacterium]MDW8103490.1 HTH domain-containing protein [Armatimonadota bacterium]